MSQWSGGALPYFAADNVATNLIQFNNDGFWFWYMDERVIHDPSYGQFLRSSVSSSNFTELRNNGGTVRVTSKAVVRSIGQRVAKRAPGNIVVAYVQETLEPATGRQPLCDWPCVRSLRSEDGKPCT